jgi:hypothetical protein
MPSFGVLGSCGCVMVSTNSEFAAKARDLRFGAR